MISFKDTSMFISEESGLPISKEKSTFVMFVKTQVPIGVKEEDLKTQAAVS